MQLERISLFSSKKEFLRFLLVCVFIFSYALLIEYNNYKNLTQFDSNTVEATVLKQYSKTKVTKKGKQKVYQVLKLRSDKGFTFYTTQKKNFPSSQAKKVKLEIYAGKINFYDYLTSFYAYSKLLHLEPSTSFKYDINAFLTLTHNHDSVASIYKALYTATTMPNDLQNKFSILGVSHLFAISGFHLGVLSGILYFLLKPPYTFLQNRYFPFRSYKVDSFLIIATVLFGYLLFLDSPPSLLRAFIMLLIGFILYDRGFQVLTMTTLFLTTLLLLSFAPRLLFSLGFWLSVFGVFYIFLFLIHFKHLSKLWQFILVPVWVYIMMLPLSLTIFENFSLLHPLSILWTSLFSLFYPLSILLHLVGYGNILDSTLLWILNLEIDEQRISISLELITSFILLSLLSVWKKALSYLLFFFALSIFIHSIYNVA